MRADELMARCAALGLNIERATDIKGTTLPEWTAEDAAHACAGLPDAYHFAFAYRYAGDDSVRRRLGSLLLIALADLANEERWSAAQLLADGFTWQPLHRFEEDGPAGLDERGIRRPDPREGRVGDRKGWIAYGPLPWLQLYDLAIYAPAKVKPLPRLVELVLLEESLATTYPAALAQLRAIDCWPEIAGFERRWWARYGFRQFEAARAIFEEWCGTAYSHVARRIREDHDCDAA